MEYTVTIEERAEQPSAVVRGHASRDELPAFLGAAFGETAAAIAAAHLFPAGPPFGCYRIVEDGFDVEAGFPSSGPVPATGRVVGSVVPGGSVATTMHVGSYEGVAEAYAAVGDWLEEHGYVVTGDPWECYLDGPEVAEPRTLICFPCSAS